MHFLVRMLASAELAFLLARSNDFLISVKSSTQRTPLEQKRVASGVRRSLVLEALVMVPTSAVLLFQLSPLLPFERLLPARIPESATASLLGICSYGFPFVAIKRITLRIALNALREFASITSHISSTSVLQIGGEARSTDERP
jgi:hypothetical protein